MKKIALIIVVILAVATAYFLFVGDNTEEGVLSTQTKSGEVTEVSLDQMAFDGPGILKAEDNDGNIFTIAVPSMGIQLCSARENIAEISNVAVGDMVEVSGILDENSQVVPCQDEDHYLRITGYMTDSVYGYEFEYLKGPDGYITLEDNESTDSDYVTGITLFNKKEYEILKQSLDAREGPPSINLRIYRNSENLHAPVWAERKPLETNINLAIGEPSESVVGGANATFFIADGLYPIDTYVVANGEHVYVLMGSYLDRDSEIYRDFQKLVSSFTFIPTSAEAPQGKIDPRVACESALAYMTFPSGVEADAFVEACVEGKHPEVIDRYIKDMGWDAKAI